MDTSVLFVGGAALLSLLALGVWAFARTGTRGRVVIATAAGVLLIAAAWFTIASNSTDVWVDSLGAVDGKIEFAAPGAHGSASGSGYYFVSTATPDAVFAAFIDAYPEAIRDGNLAELTIGDQTFTLTYFPDSDDMHYTLVNEHAAR